MRPLSFLLNCIQNSERESPALLLLITTMTSGGSGELNVPPLSPAAVEALEKGFLEFRMTSGFSNWFHGCSRVSGPPLRAFLSPHKMGDYRRGREGMFVYNYNIYLQKRRILVDPDLTKAATHAVDSPITLRLAVVVTPSAIAASHFASSAAADFAATVRSRRSAQTFAPDPISKYTLPAHKELQLTESGSPSLRCSLGCCPPTIPYSHSRSP